MNAFENMAEACILCESLYVRNASTEGRNKLRSVQHALAAEMLDIATTTDLLGWLGASVPSNEPPRPLRRLPTETEVFKFEYEEGRVFITNKITRRKVELVPEWQYCGFQLNMQ